MYSKGNLQDDIIQSMGYNQWDSRIDQVNVPSVDKNKICKTWKHFILTVIINKHPCSLISQGQVDIYKFDIYTISYVPYEDNILVDMLVKF